MIKENGGPAFPGSKDICANEPGMTLRDYWLARRIAMTDYWSLYP